MWVGISFIISIILTNINFNATLELYIEGSLLILCLIIFLPERKKSSVLLRSPDEQKSPNLMIKEIIVLCNLLKKNDSDTQNIILLKGFIDRHNNLCKNCHCPLKNIISENANKKVSHKIRQLKPAISTNINSTEANKSLMLEYINNEFLSCTQKFTNHVSLRLEFALFMIENMKNYFGAFQELDKCEKLNPGFVEQFQIFYFRQIIKDAQFSRYDSKGMSVSASMEYDYVFKSFTKKMEKVGLLHAQLWSLLGEESPDLSKVQKAGFQILHYIDNITKLWQKMQQIATNIPKSLKLYANFNIFVLNDKEAYKTFVAKANDYSLTHANINKYKIFSQSMGDRCNFAADGTACLFISGQQGTLGVISDCNFAACREFGYQKVDLLGKQMSILIPEIAVKYHYDFMRKANKLDALDLNVYGLHRTGYIFPIALKIVDSPNLLNGSNFIVMIYIDKASATSEVAHLIVDRNFVIKNISETAASLLELTPQLILHNNILFTYLASTLQSLEFDFRKHLDKKGCEITYRYLKNMHSDNATLAEISGEIRTLISNEYKIPLSDRSIKLMCQLIELNMKENGIIGYGVKLWTPQIAHDNMPSIKRNNKYPTNDFEFRYNADFNTFMRIYVTSEQEIKSSTGSYFYIEK